jgi:D-alanyl-D-alanine carboxypeptidase
MEQMTRKKKRRLKKVAMIGMSVITLCGISYISIAALSEASETTFSYEHYFGEESSDKDSEYDGINGEEDLNMNEEDSLPDKDDMLKSDSIAVLVNKELPLPEGYVPKDLTVPDVEFQISYFDEKKQLRAMAANALEELFLAAKEEDLNLIAISGYRSYQRQYDIFTANIRKKGLEHTMQFSAKPGYSEHQTGLSIDVSTKSIKYRLDASFASTPESKWLAENAHLYGYIIRYQEDKSEITGYAYEPWHIRYVGKTFADYLYRNNLTLEEYYEFEPSIDYANEITYDNLVDFGIDLEDVIVTPEPVTEPTEETEAVSEESEAETEATGESEAEEDRKEDTITKGEGTKGDKPQEEDPAPTEGEENENVEDDVNEVSEDTTEETTDPEDETTGESEQQTPSGSDVNDETTEETTGVGSM